MRLIGAQHGFANASKNSCGPHKHEILSLWSTAEKTWTLLGGSNVLTYPLQATESYVLTCPLQATESNVLTYPLQATESYVLTCPLQATESNVLTCPLQATESR